MSLPYLPGKMVLIGASDISELPLQAKIIEVNFNNSSAVLKLSNPLGIRNEIFSYAVVKVRHEGYSLDELIKRKNIICAVVLVSKSQFSLKNPFDLSWWRGGNAGIAELSLF